LAENLLGRLELAWETFEVVHHEKVGVVSGKKEGIRGKNESTKKEKRVEKIFESGPRFVSTLSGVKGETKDLRGGRSKEKGRG